mmetsp:Transcript_17845/g.42951  ORF Transcript_17845/g.42951 Transcript_17845/m.42951 type:complete len:230 (-) Transcript_17845:918-1607(-)
MPPLFDSLCELTMGENFEFPLPCCLLMLLEMMVSVHSAVNGTIPRHKCTSKPVRLNGESPNRCCSLSAPPGCIVECIAASIAHGCRRQSPGGQILQELLGFGRQFLGRARQWRRWRYRFLDCRSHRHKRHQKSPQTGPKPKYKHTVPKYPEAICQTSSRSAYDAVCCRCIRYHCLLIFAAIRGPSMHEVMREFPRGRRDGRSNRGRMFYMQARNLTVFAGCDDERVWNW